MRAIPNEPMCEWSDAAASPELLGKVSACPGCGKPDLVVTPDPWGVPTFEPHLPGPVPAPEWPVEWEPAELYDERGEFAGWAS